MIVQPKPFPLNLFKTRQVKDAEKNVEKNPEHFGGIIN
jgi:hypothetical protein